MLKRKEEGMRQMRHLRRRKGQSMTEYALVLAFVIAFLYAIRGYFTSHMSGAIIAGVNAYENSVETALTNIGGGTIAAFAPTSTSNADSTSNLSYAGSGNVTSTTDADSTQNTTTSW